jgi:hypothetical protein
MQGPAAPAFACASATEPETVGLQDYAIRLTGGDPTLAGKRQAYTLPVTPASQVTIVTTRRVCERAAQAYHKALHGAAAPQISRTVVVIKIGTTRYFVLDPADKEGEFQSTVIFDASFTPLLGFDS